jgi:hypothetical protein
VNDREFRQHVAEMLERKRGETETQTNKEWTTADATTKPAVMTNREFRKHIQELLARQPNQDQPPTKKPPNTETSVKPEVTNKKPPASVTGTLKVRRKAN